jgi:gas vesicle protein GvpG
VGLVTGLLGLPLVPIRGVVWLAEQVLEEAEGQLHDPGRIRAQLEQVDEARRRGLLSEEECSAIENELLERLMHRPS